MTTCCDALDHAKKERKGWVWRKKGTGSDGKSDEVKEENERERERTI